MRSVGVFALPSCYAYVTLAPTSSKGAGVPVIEVKLYDRRVTEESVPKIISALTDALAESSGAAKEHIHVIVEGVSPKNWGIAGKPQG
jgi:4-oxalocrotonate tautomerase